MEIRVYYEDTDAGGMVYYSNHLKSLTFAQQVLRVNDGKLLATGKVKLACVGPGMKPQRLPEEIIQAIKE